MHLDVRFIQSFRYKEVNLDFDVESLNMRWITHLLYSFTTVVKTVLYLKVYNQDNGVLYNWFKLYN